MREVENRHIKNENVIASYNLAKQINDQERMSLFTSNKL